MGFTAYASQTRTFLAGDVVIFDVAISNFGGHYEPTTSTFYCPYHAVYLVNINLVSEYGRMGADIWKDNTRIGEAVVYPDAEVRSTASALVITECDSGQVIWIRNDTDDDIMFGGNGNPRSLFSVFLLQRIN